MNMLRCIDKPSYFLTIFLKAKIFPRFTIDFYGRRVLLKKGLKGKNLLLWKQFLARLDEVQEELLHYLGIGVSVGVSVGGVSKMLKFLR